MCVSSIPKSPPSTQSPSSQASGISSISLGGSCWGLLPPAHRLFNIWGGLVLALLRCSAGSSPPFPAEETAKLWNQCHFSRWHSLNPQRPALIRDDYRWWRETPWLQRALGWAWGAADGQCSTASHNLGDGLIRPPLFPCNLFKAHLHCHRRM